MPNDLTGDFDVVAEFAIPAVNRVLAAMHRTQRVPHSMTLRVDDNPPPGSKVGKPSVVASVDALGDVTVDHTRVGKLIPLAGELSAAHPIYAVLDPVVNAGMVDATWGPIVPSHLQGIAQLQVSPPTFEVTDASGANITGRVQIMARYFPDPNTSPLAEFVRGELKITASVNQVTSQVANVVDVDIKANQLHIAFEPKWSSHPVSAAQPLSAEDVAGINLLIRNALKTSFLPSYAVLPSNVNFIQFKTLLGASGALALLLNMNGARGNPGTLNNVLLRAADDFAYAAGRDFVVAAFHPDISQPIHYWVYTVSLKKATLDLQSGKIVVTVNGHAHTPKSYLPDFDFSIHQDFTLKLASMTPGDPLNTAELVAGAIGGGVTGWLVNLFGGDTLGALSQQPGQSPQDTVRHMFSLDENLGKFLNSLLKPADQQAGAQPQEDLKPQLAYTSVEIQPSGIVLHGSLAVTDWPAAHVEFAQIPATSGGAGIGGIGGLFTEGPDYSALKSWIPGGTIQDYEWRSQGQTQGYTDYNRFVLMHSGPAATGGMSSMAVASGAVSTGVVPAYTLLCLTVRGTRLSSSGAVVAQPVSATLCGYSGVSLVEGLDPALAGALMVALTQRGPHGLVEITGHASAQADQAGGDTPNRIVHFADEKTADSLQFLLQALRQSKREDAATAVLAVLTAEQLAKARYTEGIIYAEEQGSAWERAFGVGSSPRPLTLIVGPKGNRVWRHEGQLDIEALAAALRKHLAPGGFVRPRMLGLSVRIGRRAPNFLFEVAPGRALTLRKLGGRPAVLVFWKSSSKPSLEAVRDLQETSREAGGRVPVVLAINDGETAQLAKKVAPENRFTATLVADPQRRIARAYGVSIWPTTVFLDASGLVRKIRYGSATVVSLQRSNVP